MTVSPIRFADHDLVPWKNGLGMTREVAGGTDRDGRMQWRISLATVDRDGPFSDFTGYKRIIMMLEGGGMTLDFGPHGSAVLERPFVPVTFDGGWPTSATLHAGPTRDLNVVTARESAASAVEVMALPGPSRCEGHGLTLVHVLRGRARTADGTVLETGDTLRIDGEDHATLQPEGDGTLLYRIDIDLAPASRAR
jgi:environmental stress-induced protein Ves